MRKKGLLCFSIVALTTSLLVFSFTFTTNNPINLVRSDNSTYSLLLDGNNKITTATIADENESSNSVETTNHNSLQLSMYQVVNNEGGWQTIKPGGYIYNPVTSSGDNNKISGIKSIKYTGTGSLELHYGYSINNEEILYSFEETLTAGTKYLFNEDTPSYFYIKNVGNSNVDIDELEIKYSCVEQSYPLNNLKILMIGNSFADDTVFYAQRIANSLGINLEIYDAYIAGCTLNTHYSNLQNESNTYSMRSMNGSSWNYANDMSLNSIINYRTWDVITFQQASAEIGRPTTYSNLESLVYAVKSIVSGDPKCYWHQTWAYDQDYSEYYDYFSYFNNDQQTMFDAIVDCYENQVLTTGLFEKTIFNGTAVQNMRSTYMGDTICRDGKHMSSVHGRYLIACNFISAVYGIDLSLSPVRFIPEGMNEEYQKLVYESINNARKHPDVVTNSVYTSEIYERYDLSNYTEIDAGLVGCSYYYSQDDSDYNIRINHYSGTSNKFVSSTRFTQSTLPIGSLIFIKEGLGYRAEAWVNDSRQNFRIGEAYESVIEVDEDFWNGYQYRAFNIFKSGKQPLSDQYVDEQYDDIFNGFHIFVPNSQMEGLQPKTYNAKYLDDKSLFTTNGYNIDNYQRVHLDPITGFYKCDSYYYLLNSYVDDTAQKFVCTRPFFTASNDLPVNSIIIVDSGYQWRSDCWGARSTYSPRPNNISTNFYVTDSSFMSPYRRRTFNVSSTSSSYVRQNSIAFMNHMRIYIPVN